MSVKITTSAGTSASSGINQQNDTGEDSEITSLRRQITDIKQQIQKVNTNKTLSDDEKTEKKKELNDEISDVNNQIIQRRQAIEEEKQAQKQAEQEMEQAAEEIARQQSADSSQDNSGTDQDGDTVSITQQASFQVMNKAIITASSSMNQAQQLNTMRVDFKDSAAVAESEAKTAASLGDSSVSSLKSSTASGFEEAAMNIGNEMGQKMKESRDTVATTRDAVTKAGQDGDSDKTDKSDKTDDDDNSKDGTVSKDGNAASTDGTVNAGSNATSTDGTVSTGAVSQDAESLSDEEKQILRNKLTPNRAADQGSLINEYL